MKHLIEMATKRAIFIAVLLVFTMTLSAQESSGQAFEKAKKEITETFGTFPSMFDAFPKYALPGAWQAFKELTGPQGSIDPKNRELIQLAVAAQIPCDYCVFFHTLSAQAFGATDEEIKEAVAYGAQTRHWSMIIQGAQIDLEDFKVEFQEMMKYMGEKAKSQ
jgi:AhpD family alkylhydroperoxidase